MSDIVERLRDVSARTLVAALRRQEEQWLLDAAAEIERLRELLREALEDGYIRVPYGASHEDVAAILDFEKRIREAI